MGSDTQSRIRKNLKFGFLSILLQCGTLFLPTGNPGTTGTILEADYVANARVDLRYAIYDKYNGASSNRDGTARNARDNNTLYPFPWMAI